MKILAPREDPSPQDCGSHQCPSFDCGKFYMNGTLQTRKPKKKASMRCNVYWCDRVFTCPPQQGEGEAQ